MKKKTTYYSYCCGKYVSPNSDRRDLVEQRLLPLKGYHCSRCHKQLTVYGNPVLEIDKYEKEEKERELRKTNGIPKTAKYEVGAKGELIFKHKTYEGVDLDTPKQSELWRDFVIFDTSGRFVALVRLKHKSGALYVEGEPFHMYLKAAKLSAISVDYYTRGQEKGVFSSKVEMQQNAKKFRETLEARGFAFKTPEKKE